MYIVLANANLPVHQVLQGVIQDGLWLLVYDVDDMHRSSHNIEGDMKF
jgi:hypothetical protein